jgi:hypothetical protein
MSITNDEDIIFPLPFLLLIESFSVLDSLEKCAQHQSTDDESSALKGMSTNNFKLVQNDKWMLQPDPGINSDVPLHHFNDDVQLYHQLVLTLRLSSLVINHGVHITGFANGASFMLLLSWLGNMIALIRDDRSNPKNDTIGSFVLSNDENEFETLDDDDDDDYGLVKTSKKSYGRDHIMSYEELKSNSNITSDSLSKIQIRNKFKQSSFIDKQRSQPTDTHPKQTDITDKIDTCYEPTQIIPIFCPYLLNSSQNQEKIAGKAIIYDALLGHLALFHTSSGVMGAVNLTVHTNMCALQLHFDVRLRCLCINQCTHGYILTVFPHQDIRRRQSSHQHLGGDLNNINIHQELLNSSQDKHEENVLRLMKAALEGLSIHPVPLRQSKLPPTTSAMEKMKLAQVE